MNTSIPIPEPPLLSDRGFARKGKIARLPREIRDELNRRLDDGTPAKYLLQWLDSLPLVRALLTRDFEGSPISEQNISEWRLGGFKDWVLRQEADELFAEMMGVEEPTEGRKKPVTREMPEFSSARVAHRFFRFYVASSDRQASQAETAEARWKALRAVNADLAEIQNEEYRKERLQLAWAKLQTTGEITREKFMEFARKNKEWLVESFHQINQLTNEERKARTDAILA